MAKAVKIGEGSKTQAQQSQIHSQKRQLAQLLGKRTVFIGAALKIQDKNGALVPLRLNSVQKRLLEEIDRAERAGRPCRLIILKARQMGISTAVAAAFYHKTISRRNTNSLIVAHKTAGGTAIFNKCKLFYELSPPPLRPRLKSANAGELYFAGSKGGGLRSKIGVETAGSKEAGRSLTVHNLHLSELAFWPFAEQTLAALLQTVPNNAETSVIIESTACGLGGCFYEQWQKAERGESGFTPLFFPWFAEEGYRLPPPEDFALTDKERQLKEDFNLADDQLAWRRHCIETNCQGSEDIFHQEYPSTPDEAFLLGGRPVFEGRALNLALRSARPPQWRGRLITNGADVEFCEQTGGLLRIWTKPRAGEEYILGADSAAGIAGGDYAAVSVVEAVTRRQVAELHGHIEPDLLGRELALLGQYYNNALIVPEANNHGAAVIAALRNDCYPRIYRRRSINKVTGGSSREYGFLTTCRTKPLLIDALSAYLREDARRVQSAACLRECLSYAYDEAGHAGALSGCHDDRVMALALAVYAACERSATPGRVYCADYGRVDEVTGY